nr:SENV-D [SEN virus]
MHFSKITRKKRKLLLQTVPLPKSQRTTMSWSRPVQNVSICEQHCFKSCLQSHACFCGCNNPVIHFNHIATRFNYLPTANPPVGPSQPPTRPPSRLRPLAALAAPPAAQQAPWSGAGGSSGGGEESNQRGRMGERADGEDLDAEDLDALMAAVEEDQQ